MVDVRQFFEYATGFEYTRVLNMYAKVLNIPFSKYKSFLKIRGDFWREFKS